MPAGMAPTPKNLRISCPQIPAQTRVLKKQPGPKSLSLVLLTFGITELNYFKLQGFLKGGLKKKKASPRNSTTGFFPLLCQPNVSVAGKPFYQGK